MLSSFEILCIYLNYYLYYVFISIALTRTNKGKAYLKQEEL